MKDNIRSIVLIATAKGRIDKGSETPIRGNNSLTNSPTNIIKAILKPTENNNSLTALFRFNFRILRINIPGINER